MATFPFDTEIRLSINWTQNGSPKDATTSLIVENPAGVETTYSSTAIAHPSTGYYYLDLDGNVAGTWEYRFIAANPKGAAESFFVVEQSRINSLNP